MPGDMVNVPFLGNQRKEYLIAGGVVAVGYLVWKRRSAAKSSAAAGAASTAAPGATGPGTFVGYDATGAPVYQNAQGQDVDANGNPDTLVTPVGTAGGGAFVNPAPITVSGAQGGGAGSAPQTDQAWTSAVEQDLTGIGYDPQAVATALAQYLASQPLDSNQVTIIRTAWAYEGRPPQHPSLPIVQQQSGGNPPSGGGGGGTGGGGGNKPLKPGTVLQLPWMVQSGQSWQSIAKQAETSVANVQASNPGVTTLKPGQVIHIPWMVQSGQTLQSIATQTLLNTDQVQQAVNAAG